MLKTLLFIAMIAVTMTAGTMVAQIDSSTLRTRFGPPLDRETFRMPEGFNLIVDYGPHHQVCRAEVPAQMPTDPAASVTSTEVQARKMDAFLAALFPLTMRGKEVSVRAVSTGLNFITTVEYEKLALNRTNDHVFVQFKDAACSLNP